MENPLVHLHKLEVHNKLVFDQFQIIYFDMSGMAVLIENYNLVSNYFTIK